MTNDLYIANRAERILKSMSYFKMIKIYSCPFRGFSDRNGMITIAIDDNKINFKNIQVTDVYPILYGIFSYYAICQNIVLIHSSVVYNGEKSIMILGDFGSGKTFLSLGFRDKKWEIISADQSLISKVRNTWLILDGSTYMKTENNYEQISFDGYPIKLDNLVMLRGLANNGDVDISRIENKSLIRKKIVYAMMWQYVTPLTNGEIFDFKYTNFCKLIYVVLSKLDIVPTYFIRGDSRKCIVELEKMIEE